MNKIIEEYSLHIHTLILVVVGSILFSFKTYAGGVTHKGYFSDPSAAVKELNKSNCGCKATSKKSRGLTQVVCQKSCSSSNSNNKSESSKTSKPKRKRAKGGCPGYENPLSPNCRHGYKAANVVHKMPSAGTTWYGRSSTKYAQAKVVNKFKRLISGNFTMQIGNVSKKNGGVLRFSSGKGQHSTHRCGQDVDLGKDSSLELFAETLRDGNKGGISASVALTLFKRQAGGQCWIIENAAHGDHWHIRFANRAY